MRKLIGILMIVIGGFFMVAAVLAISHLPGNVRRLKEAPFITDGVLDPANEGKTVILTIHIEDIGDASDDELGFHFSYPCVTRDVEQLTCTLSNKKWEWKKIKDTDDTIGCRSFFGDASVGDFQIEGDLLRGLALYSDLYRSDFDQEELTRFLNSYNNVTTEIWNDRFYITNASSSWYLEDFEYDGEDSVTRSDYEREEGAIRIRYRGLPRESYSRITVIGKQQGNWIVEDDRIDALTVYDDIDNVDALVRQVVLLTLGGIVLAMVPCVPLVFFGVRRLTRDY